MARFLAFDVYGTLIDTAGVTDGLRTLVGDNAPIFAKQWREKQLEYSFRRALMQDYVDFSVCTAQSLLYTCKRFNVALSGAEQERLLAFYRALPAYPDVAPGLALLASLPVHLFAFSNGQPDDLEVLLQSAGIRHYFEGVVSLYDVRTYKPNPAAYAYFHRAARTGGSETWLISSNPFDIIGAQATGMRAVWLQRDPTAIFDPWDVEPTVTATSLADIVRLFGNPIAP
ncbi:MAG: haloacid dehalogenase type II [Caldilineaceae bacterium]|nr:haloacid dehalogenase type II [Caldilineaceae bacterium]